MSADTVSALFPDRPIRPLPKRRLRERLSPEVAESIQYPPAPRAIFPLFSPYILRDEENDSNSGSARNRGSEMNPRPARRNGLRVGEEHDSMAIRGSAGRDTASSARLGRHQTKSETGRNGSVQVPMSSASSLDGYDAFENTNNKKKRKIPSAGDSLLHSGNTTSDNNTSGGSLSTVEDPVEANGEASLLSAAAYGNGSFGASGQNVAGPGRGRYGRSRSARSPLRPLPDSTSNRNGKVRPAPWTVGPSENTGIISDAIAKAEKLPLPRGQENMSLLQQQLSKKRGPTSAKFTFTCSSQVPGSLAWPDADATMPLPPHQTSSPRQAQQTGQAPLLPPDAESMPKEAASQARAPSPASAERAARRTLARECDAAARARRRQTLLNNRRHPPKPEEVWICHFCEYESIFGQPPYALIRQYEIKDRKQRQLEQQRKAQWERLKKGKHKGKKNSKLPAKNNDAVHESAESHGSVDAPSGGMNSNYSQGTQSEEYYDDEEYQDDEYDPDEDIPPDDGLDICEHTENARPQPGHHPGIVGGGGT
ncbi:hypothetical protein QBC37DRAFT_13487 [Rhypophila decipiens]|uniref:Uncharacterized protein n=1 Tax=Rhypophila decipiens TaxID=261697 RepID=A0AAN6Y775_9PEZI|nr:hypothetical protein QBC37DRAFT_13487 [Rhypophila decipiens]